MKLLRKLIHVQLIITVAFILQTGNLFAAAPTATTNAATSITSTGATLNGTVSPATGGDSPTDYGFFWRTSSGADGTGTKVTVGTGSFTGPISHALSGLSPSTTYYFQAYYEYDPSGPGTSAFVYGTELSFTTSASCTFTPTNIPDVTINNPAVLAMNANGGATGNWVAGSGYSPVGNAGSTGDAVGQSLGLPDVAPDAIYQTTLWGNPVSLTGTGLTASTDYFIRVHLMEDFHTANGLRIFDVDVTDGATTQKIADDLDLHATAGHDEAYYVEAITSSDASGNLIVTGTASVDNAVLNGVEIRKGTTLTASGGVSYLWSTGATTASIDVSPDVTTVYTVTITDGSGCVGVETVTVTITNNPDPPNVTTSSASGIGATSGTMNANIADNGGDAITSYGFYYSTTPGFTAPAGTQVEVGTADITGNYSHALTGLTEGTTYYFQAYATNSYGTTYGAEFSFTPTSFVADYYINDNSLVGDNWCSAVGNTWASGARGGTGDPLASLSDLFANATLSPGDVIAIDAGTYTGWATATVTTTGTSGNPITIVGTGTTTDISSTGTGLHFNSGIKYWDIEDLMWSANGSPVVYSFGAGPAQSNNNQFLNFDNVTFVQNGNNDIFYSNHTSDVSITNSTFTHNFSGAVKGINLASESRDWTITNNTFTMADNTAGSAALSLNNQTGGTMSGNSIINGESGVRTGSGNLEVWTIDNNYFCSNDYGVWNEDNLSYVVTNNRFYNNNSNMYGPGTNGLKFWTITGNYFYTTSSSTGHAGVHWDNPASNPTTLDNNTYWSPNGASIVIHNGSNHATLAAWQAASSYDGSSTEADPNYDDPASCNLDIGLPVNYYSFTGECGLEGIQIDWATYLETNNDYFTVERSDNGYDFYPVAQITGAGTSGNLSSYAWIDRESSGNGSYYRLVQTDFDGKTEVHDKIIYVDECASADDGVRILRLYNAQGNTRLSFISGVEQHYEIKMASVLGQVIYSEEGVTSAEVTNKTFLNKNLSPGVYLVVVVVDGEKLTGKIAINQIGE